MRRHENGSGRERRPEEGKAPEREESFLERFQLEEESERGENVETLIEQVARTLKESGREEMDLLWSSLEPLDELLWNRRGNTIRYISLKCGHYAEHVELGVCELGEGLHESLEALKKRSILQAVCLSVLEPSASRQTKLHYLEIHGGIENWRKELEAAVRELTSGALPDRLVLTLTEAAGEAWFHPSFKGGEVEGILLKRDGEDLVMELPKTMVPRETRIELPEGMVAGTRGDPVLNVWRFRPTPGMGWHVFLYRPLVMYFTEYPTMSAYPKPLWPSIGLAEFFEVVTKHGVYKGEKQDSW